MTTTPSEPAPPDPQAPFGADPRRSKTPVVFLSILFVCWLLILIWMAVFRPGA